MEYFLYTKYDYINTVYLSAMELTVQFALNEIS